MFDVEQTVLSQYANSPAITSLVESWNEAIDPTVNLQNFYVLLWNIQTAEGFGLDNLGTIIGLSRYLELAASGQFFGFRESGNDWLPFNDGPFFSGGNYSLPLYPMSDTAYRMALLAKALANVSNSSIQACNAVCRTLVGANCFVVDLGNMLMEYVLTGSPTQVQIALVEHTGILIHPTGVNVVYGIGSILYANMVAGAGGGNVGFSPAIPFGSLTPVVDVNGNTVVDLVYTAGGQIVLQYAGTSLGAAYFNVLNVNGIALAASSATFLHTGGNSQWTWTAPGYTLVNGGLYAVAIS